MKAGTERESRWGGVGFQVELLRISVEVGGFITMGCLGVVKTTQGAH